MSPMTLTADPNKSSRALSTTPWSPSSSTVDPWATLSPDRLCNGITGGIVLTSHTVDPEPTLRFCYDFLFHLCLSFFCFIPGLPLKPAPLYHSCTQPRTFLSF